MTTSTVLTAAQVSERLQCSTRKVRAEAVRHGIGFNVGGSAGFRFTEADVTALIDAMRLAPAPRRQRRTRGAA